MDIDEGWLQEFQSFISHWEQETESIKRKILDTKECCRIADDFHRNSDRLLARRPVDTYDKDAFDQLERLDHKLNSSLAMVYTCSDEQS